MNILSLEILGVPAHSVDFDTTVKVIRDAIDDGYGQRYVVALNAEKIMMARRDPEIMRILRDAHLLIPDGVGVSLASRILYGKPVPRVPGFDLFLALVQLAAHSGKGLFLLGGDIGVVETAGDLLTQAYPGLKVVGQHHGYFTDDGPVIEKINKARPDLLFVGMGSPKQEKWIYRNISKLNVRLCFGVGGSFDVIAGKAKLAPAAIRRLGFEFVYRLIMHPKRLRRQLVFPDFLAYLLASRTGLSRSYGNHRSGGS